MGLASYCRKQSRMRINCILCINQERRTKSKEVVWVRVKKRNKCQHKVVNVRGLCKTNEFDTAMDANWATLNCCTSMVQMVLYSRYMETTVPCSPYCTCLRYDGNAPTERTKAITKFIIVKSQTRARQQSTRMTTQHCSNSQGTRGSKTVMEQEAERERKEDKEA